MTPQIVAWLLTFMFALAPTNRKQFHPDAIETPEEATARYTSIATDIISVVWDPENQPLFTGPYGRAKSAAIMMSVMFHESSFRRDVDYGLGKAGRGDGGRSWCLMQVKIEHEDDRTATWNKTKHRFKQWGDRAEDLVEGWTGPELVQARTRCIEAGYRIMRASFGVCRTLPVPAWLRAYASGNCDDGVTESEVRMNLGINWFNKHKPTFADTAIERQEPVDPLALSP